MVQGPPTLFHALIERATEGADALGTLRVGVTGAAVIPPTLVRDMLDVLGLQLVVTAYGLTETTGVCTMTRPGDPIEVVAETSGRPIEGVDVQIVDEAGVPVPAGSRGEIAVRGIGLMAGYLDDPEATDATMRGEWLATGDVGWIGEDGNLRIVDRLKDMVVVGGFNVYPAEVERVLLEHAAVSQAAVIGLPDARMGEVPGAFVVPAPGAAIDVEALVGFLGAAVGEVQGAPHRVGGRPAPAECGGQGRQGGAAVRRRHPPGLLAPGAAARAVHGLLTLPVGSTHCGSRFSAKALGPSSWSG